MYGINDDNLYDACHNNTQCNHNSIPFIASPLHRSGQYMDLEDLELYVPPVEDALTNDIENFPFPTIFDFISEINRPVDPFTMSGNA